VYLVFLVRVALLFRRLPLLRLLRNLRVRVPPVRPSALSRSHCPERGLSSTQHLAPLLYTPLHSATQTRRGVGAHTPVPLQCTRQRIRFDHAPEVRGLLHRTHRAVRVLRRTPRCVEFPWICASWVGVFSSFRSYSRTAQQERVGTDCGGGGEWRLCRQGKRQSSEHSAVAAGNDSDACDM
jgi:hypothetical protein